MNRYTKKLLIRILLLIINAIVIYLLLTSNNKDKINVIFSSCVDGDTAKFIVNNKIETVRFLAVDTPETVHPNKEVEYYGKEASTFTCNELKKAKNLFLEFDTNSDKYDKYRRLLAWVFVDEVLLQKQLVAKGYAKVAYLYDDYKYTSILLNVEAESKQKRLGIWYNIEK